MTLTPSAYAREAERLRHMERRASDAPAGYTPESWRRRCRELSREYEERARHDS